MKFKKDFSLRIFSLFLVVLFFFYSTASGIGLSEKNTLRKPLDFNNSEGASRYLAVLDTYREPLVLTIDGIAGVGKSTVAREIAQGLKGVYISLGEIYRLFTWIVLLHGIDPTSKDGIEELRSLCMSSISYKQLLNGEWHLFYKDRDVAIDLREELYSQEINNRIASVSKNLHLIIIPLVKGIVDVLQEKGRSVVVEGRIAGTIIAPEADIKIELFADSETRAVRRAKELTGEETPSTETVLEIQKELEVRDGADRQHIPKSLAEIKDIVSIDTTHLGKEEVRDKILSLVAELIDTRKSVIEHRKVLLSTESTIEEKFTAARYLIKSKSVKDRILVTDTLNTIMLEADTENAEEARHIASPVVDGRRQPALWVIRGKSKGSLPDIELTAEEIENIRQRMPFVITRENEEHLKKVFRSAVKLGLIRPTIAIDIKRFSYTDDLVYIKYLRELSEEYNGNITFVLSVIEDDNTLKHDMACGMTLASQLINALGEDYYRDNLIFSILDGGEKERTGNLVGLYRFQGLFPLPGRQRVIESVMGTLGTLALSYPELGMADHIISADDTDVIFGNLNFGGEKIDKLSQDRQLILYGIKRQILEPKDAEYISSRIAEWGGWNAVTEERLMQDPKISRILKWIKDENLPKRGIFTSDSGRLTWFAEKIERVEILKKALEVATLGDGKFRDGYLWENIFLISLHKENIGLQLINRLAAESTHDGRKKLDLEVSTFKSLVATRFVPDEELDIIRDKDPTRPVTPKDWRELAAISRELFSNIIGAGDYGEGSVARDIGTVEAITHRWQEVVTKITGRNEIDCNISPEVKILGDNYLLRNVTITGNGVLDLRGEEGVCMENDIVHLDGETLRVTPGSVVVDSSIRGLVEFHGPRCFLFGVDFSPYDVYDIREDGKWEPTERLDVYEDELTVTLDREDGISYISRVIASIPYKSDKIYQLVGQKDMWASVALLSNVPGEDFEEVYRNNVTVASLISKDQWPELIKIFPYLGDLTYEEVRNLPYVRMHWLMWQRIHPKVIGIRGISDWESAREKDFLKVPSYFGQEIKKGKKVLDSLRQSERSIWLREKRTRSLIDEIIRSFQMWRGEASGESIEIKESHYIDTIDIPKEVLKEYIEMESRIRIASRNARWNGAGNVGNAEFCQLYSKMLELHTTYFASLASIDYLAKYMKTQGKEFPQRILDLGSGPSVFYRAYQRAKPRLGSMGVLSAFGTEVVDFDISEEMLKAGTNPGVQIRGDMSEVGEHFEKETFDLVNTSFSLKYTEFPIKTLRGVSEILKQNGLVMIILPSNEKIPQSFYESLGQLGFEIQHEPGARLEKGLDQRSYETLVDMYGIEHAEAVLETIKGGHNFILAKKINMPQEDANITEFIFSTGDKREEDIGMMDKIRSLKAKYSLPADFIITGNIIYPSVRGMGVSLDDERKKLLELIDDARQQVSTLTLQEIEHICRETILSDIPTGEEEIRKDVAESIVKGITSALTSPSIVYLRDIKIRRHFLLDSAI